MFVWLIGCRLSAPPCADEQSERAHGGRLQEALLESGGQDGGTREVTDEEFAAVFDDEDGGGNTAGDGRGGEFACVGVCGGEWSFARAGILAGNTLDALRTSFASSVS